MYLGARFRKSVLYPTVDLKHIRKFPLQRLFVMASKRKWSEANDSDDEEPALGRQVLPVANLPADFTGVPQDGLQYLFMVR